MGQEGIPVRHSRHRRWGCGHSAFQGNSGWGRQGARRCYVCELVPQGECGTRRPSRRWLARTRSLSGQGELAGGSRDEASRDPTVVRSMDRAQRRGCSRPVMGMVGSQWRKTQHSAGWMWSPSSHSQSSGASSDSGVDLHQLTRIIRLGHLDGLQWWRIRGLRNHPLMEGCCCWAAILCSNRSAARITSNETSNVDLSLWGRLPTGSWRGATGQHTPGYTWFRLGIKFSSSSRVRNSALIPCLTPWTRSQCGLRLCCQGVCYVYTGSGQRYRAMWLSWITLQCMVRAHFGPTYCHQCARVGRNLP